MSLILAIETATPVCSVALSKGNDILSLRETVSPNAHSSVLTRFIEEVFRETSFRYADPDAVAVSMGPGSYTGLRIGVASAKGLCYALDKPLIAVPTLKSMANGMRRAVRSGMRDRETGSFTPGTRNPEPETLFCPMIDARRMEVFCAVYNAGLEEIRPADAVIVKENTFDDLLEEYHVIFAGNGAGKCREILSSRANTSFPGDFRASAKDMIPLALECFLSGRFENPAYFEPFYLKDFVAGKPKVKGLR